MKNIKIFADTGSLDQLRVLVQNPIIEGFTTNPSLMAKSYVTDYEKFAKDAIKIIKEKKPDSCISLEVFSDDPLEMKEQALKIHAWGKEADFQVYVKIPILNIDGSYMTGIIELLTLAGVSLNITCVTNTDQYFTAMNALLNERVDPKPHIISVFAGRIADTGIDPTIILKSIAENVPSELTHIETLWASSRENLNIFQAEECGCDIITLFPELIAKLPLIGKHLRLVSIDTAQMFFDAAKESGFKI